MFCKTQGNILKRSKFEYIAGSAYFSKTYSKIFLKLLVQSHSTTELKIGELQKNSMCRFWSTRSNTRKYLRNFGSFLPDLLISPKRVVIFSCNSLYSLTAPLSPLTFCLQLCSLAAEHFLASRTFLTSTHKKWPAEQ